MGDIIEFQFSERISLSSSPFHDRSVGAARCANSPTPTRAENARRWSDPTPRIPASTWWVFLPHMISAFVDVLFRNLLLARFLS